MLNETQKQNMDWNHKFMEKCIKNEENKENKVNLDDKSDDNNIDL